VKGRTHAEDIATRSDRAVVEASDSRGKGLPRSLFLRRPTRMQILVSLFIAGLGFVASRALAVVDQDLRNMYTEYTLAAAKLAHTSSDLIRYRVTVVRAIEAPTQKDFERISKSLPDQRARVLQAVDRYAEASRHYLRTGSRSDQDLRGLRGSLEEYFLSTDQTIVLLIRLWKVDSPSEASALRHQAEIHAAENAGPKLVEASEALDRLLMGVAEVGRDIRDEGTNAIRIISLVLVIGSFVIAALNLLS
jgi:hypothetical protein